MIKMFVSILIPVKRDNKNLRECIEACLRLDYPDFEVMVLLDETIYLPYGDKVKIIPTGSVGPARKRDMALDKAKGEILAFLDDDAFPRADWLKNAVKNFSNEDIAAVGGPAVTPDNDTLRQKASGEVYASFLVSGPHSRRYIPKERCEVDDYPSCNFLVRKDAFRKVGGFDTKFWPGEDTVFCLKIIKELKKKIIYDPDAIVYHHRRPLFGRHLRQIKSYALHRGYFVKRFPETSFRIAYIIPSILVLGLIGGAVIAAFNHLVRFFYFGMVATYLFMGLLYLFMAHFKVAISDRRDILVPPDGGVGKPRLSEFYAVMINRSTLIFLGIVFTHLTYGIYFLKGLFLKRLAEE